MKNAVLFLILVVSTSHAAVPKNAAPHGQLLASVECTDNAGKPARIDFYPWPEAWVHRWESAAISKERFLRASAPGELDLRFFEPSSDNEFLVPRADLVETALHYSRADDGRQESWSCRLLGGSLLDPRLEGDRL